MKFFLHLLSAGFILINLTACDGIGSARAVTPSGEVIHIEVVQTAQERARGLMNRDHLNERSGMLFVFEQEQVLSFWMKNTLIPLDIVFLDGDGTIVDIQTMQPCPSQTINCPSYPSAQPALYALEVNAGLAEQLHLSVGDSLTLHYAPTPTASENN
ncbi:MAG: DUF192 domain-containing protein [bacterium]|nr:DUF192 domain-containing protein [bacterium]